MQEADALTRVIWAPPAGTGTETVSTQPFAHVTAAIATPYRADLSIDFGLLSAHAQWLLTHGCDGLVLFGTTGEAASLTIAERKAVLEQLIAEGIRPSQILVGTGCCAVADTVELTLHAAKLKTAGALLLPPFFFKGMSECGVAQFYDATIAACGKSVPPVYLYNIPQNTGAAVTPDLTATILERHGDTIRGYKDSSGDWANTSAILARFPHLHVYVSSEARLLDNLRTGGAGCISATVNMQPSTTRDLYEGWQGKNASALQMNAAAARKAVEKTGALIPAVKAAIAEIHNVARWRIPRPPMEELSEQAWRTLLLELRALAWEQ
jgi:4-hydroxy-tetrahydrodipicolinate synthase